MSADITVDFNSAAFDALTDGEALAAVAIPPALEVIRDVWVGAVSGSRLPGMARDIDEPTYAAALSDPSALVYPDADALAGAVQVSAGPAYDLAARLEHGRKPRDMKPSLLSGPKAKLGKHGRYNVIPLGFRTPIPGAPFRTVSDRSPADSWISPGHPGAHIVASVAEASAPLVEEVIRKAIREFYH